MAKWISIVCAFVVCSVNQTFSQMIDECEEFNKCNGLLVDALSSGNLVVCRTLLEYIPCMQGVLVRCPRTDPEKFKEYMTFASKTYNSSNCTEVLKEITTSNEPSHVTTGKSGLSSKGFKVTHFTTPSHTTEVAPEEHSSPKETSGNSLIPDRITKDEFTLPTFTEEKITTDPSEFNQTSKIETGTSRLSQRFAGTSMSTMFTKIPDEEDSTKIVQSTRPDIETTKSVSSNVTDTMDSSQRHTAVSAAERSTLVISPSFVPDFSSKGAGRSSQHTTLPSVHRTGSGTRSSASTRSSTTRRSSATTGSSASRRSSAITHHASGSTVKVTSSTSQKTAKTASPSTVWFAVRSSAGLVQITTAASSGRTNKLPPSSTETLSMESDKSGAFSVQTICVQTLLSVVISTVFLT